MILVVFISGVLSPGLSSGITIKEEEELSRQFLGAILANFPIIDDPIVVRYINRIGKEILASFPQQPFKYHFYVIKDDAFNAFATPAGHIFIHSGLMAAMDDEEELAGIIGHEISHVYCRHISQKIERSKKLNMATMAGMAAGILAGIFTDKGKRRHSAEILEELKTIHSRLDALENDLRNRVETLERIVTNPKEDLKRQFDHLDKAS